MWHIPHRPGLPVFTFLISWPGAYSSRSDLSKLVKAAHRRRTLSDTHSAQEYSDAGSRKLPTQRSAGNRPKQDRKAAASRIRRRREPPAHAEDSLHRSVPACFWRRNTKNLDQCGSVLIWASSVSLFSVDSRMFSSRIFHRIYVPIPYTN